MIIKPSMKKKMTIFRKRFFSGILAVAMIGNIYVPGNILIVNATSQNSEAGQTATETQTDNTTGTDSQTQTGNTTGTEGQTQTGNTTGTEGQTQTDNTTDTEGQTQTDNTTSTDSQTKTDGTTGTDSQNQKDNATGTDSQTTAEVTKPKNPDLTETGLSPKEAKVLVIDPGHCKKHPGASGNGLKEEVVVLDIAKAFRDYLESYADITIYMTRETADCCTELELGDCLTARSNYAKQLDADFLVSIHINAGYSSGANALAAYKSGYHDEVRKETQAYGKLALAELKKLGITNRGYLLRKSSSGNRYSNGKLADYYSIVRHGVINRIPAVIMEHGYITSASDCKKFFKTKAQRKKVGIADAKAMISYYKLSKKTVDGEFRTEDGKNYYVGTDGKKVCGWVKNGEEWFYFDDETGEMVTGFLTQGEDTFYLSPSTGEMVVGWFSVDGKDYIARGNGTIVKGCMYGNGVGTYLLDNSGRKLKKGFHTIDNSVYYVVSSKKVATGVAKVGSKYYGFDEETGVMLYGEQTINNKHYYFDTTTGVAAKSKIVQIDDDKYYFGKQAYGKTGWLKKGSAKYYFDTKTGAMVTGWKKISGKYYYFDENTGKMQKSKWIGKYYVNKKGVRTKTKK